MAKEGRRQPLGVSQEADPARREREGVVKLKPPAGEQRGAARPPAGSEQRGTIVSGSPRMASTTRQAPPAGAPRPGLPRRTGLIKAGGLRAPSNASHGSEAQEALPSNPPPLRGGGMRKKWLEEDDDEQGSTAITEDMVVSAAKAAGLPPEKLISLDLESSCISCIACLRPCPQLRVLNLQGNKIRIVEGLDSLAQLKELRLGYNRIWSLSGVSKNAALEDLNVQANRIETIEKGWLSVHKKLRVLRINNNRLKKLSNLDALVSLTHLDASCNSLTKIEGLGMAAQMENLDLSFNQITSLVGMDATAWLKELDISSNCITSMAGLKRCERLEILRLQSNQMSDMNGMPRLNSLLELYLANNQISSCARHVSKNCPALEFLGLADNQIQDLSELKRFSTMTCLIDLKLARNPLCEKTEYISMAREHLTSLDSLDDLVLREMPTLVSEEDEQDSPVNRILQGGGEVADTVAERKELAEVLDLEFFVQQMRGMRDGLRQLRADIQDVVVQEQTPTKKYPAPLAAPKAVTRSKNVAAGGYTRGDAAVSAALGRARMRAGVPSLKELMRKEEERRIGAKSEHGEGGGVRDAEVEPPRLARSDYLMSKQLQGFPGEEASPVKDSGNSEERLRGMPAAFRHVQSEIDKMLAMATKEITDEDERQAQDKGLLEQNPLQAAMERIAAAAAEGRPFSRQGTDTAGSMSSLSDSDFAAQAETRPETAAHAPLDHGVQITSTGHELRLRSEEGGEETEKANTGTERDMQSQGRAHALKAGGKKARDDARDSQRARRGTGSKVQATKSTVSGGADGPETVGDAKLEHAARDESAGVMAWELEAGAQPHVGSGWAGEDASTSTPVTAHGALWESIPVDTAGSVRPVSAGGFGHATDRDPDLRRPGTAGAGGTDVRVDADGGRPGTAGDGRPDTAGSSKVRIRIIEAQRFSHTSLN